MFVFVKFILCRVGYYGSRNMKKRKIEIKKGIGVRCCYVFFNLFFLNSLKFLKYLVFFKLILLVKSYDLECKFLRDMLYFRYIIIYCLLKR